MFLLVTALNRFTAFCFLLRKTRLVQADFKTAYLHLDLARGVGFFFFLKVHN